jgi:acyl carrier protein
VGLDAIEVVLELERRFGVRVEDERLRRVHTAGDLLSLVREQRPRVACASQVAFHRLRRRLVSCGVARAAVRPGACVSSVSREVWLQLEEDDVLREAVHALGASQVAMRALVSEVVLTACGRLGAWRDADGWLVVQAVVAEQLGVDFDVVQPGSRLVADLGLD